MFSFSNHLFGVFLLYFLFSVTRSFARRGIGSDMRHDF